MKTTLPTKPRTSHLRPLILAVSLTLPTGLLMAQDADRTKDRTTTRDAADISAEIKDLEIYQGKLVSLHAHLSGLEHASETRTQTADRRDAAKTGRNSDRPQGQSMDNPEGPLGLVVHEEGILGLGQGTEFYVLTFDPRNDTSREAYARTVRFSHTGNFLKMSDRDYVRTSADDKDGAAKKQTELAQQAVNKEEPIRDDDRFVRVTGRIVKRDNVEAIVVHSISPASREHKPEVQERYED